MGKKIFWFDVETTGLDSVTQDIVQLAFIIEINGEVKEKGNFLMQPFDYKTIDNSALEVQGRTIEDLKTYSNPNQKYNDLIDVLDKYVDRYNPMDKFYLAGYNSGFDLAFLKQFFIKNEDSFFGSWFNYRCIDPLAMLYVLDGFDRVSIENYKLCTVCKHYGIPLNAHDALSDITATRTLANYLIEKYYK